MRWDEVARGVVVVLELLDGDIADAPPVSLELLLGALLLGALLLGGAALDASGDVLVLGVVVVLLPDVLDPLLGAGGVGSTSPPDVLVTVPLGDAALLGMQSVVVAALEVAPLVEADMPLVLDGDVLALVDARPATESVLVVAVVPVPLAPFVVFRPVNR